MNLILGRSLLGRSSLAGTAKTAALLINYPLLDSGFVINFYNSMGIRTAQISSDMLNNPIASFEFELITTGCGAFTLTMDKKHTVEIGYNQRVDISLFGDIKPWFSGYIQRIPQAGSTDDMAVYSGFGFFNQLDDLFVNETFEDIEISKIVDSVAKKIELKSRIVYNKNKIYSTGYTATKLTFDFIKAKEAIKTLAEFAVNYLYGVDERRELFFKPANMEINEKSRFWVGHHVQQFVPEEDTSKIVNFFYVKGGELKEGSNMYVGFDGLPVPFTDAQSVADYGLKEDVLSIPSAIGEADIERWGISELDRLKSPQRSAKVDKFSPDVIRRNIKPDGMAQIITGDGKIYQYPIKSVKYKLGKDGAQLSMQLGEYSNRLDKYIAKLFRDGKNAEFAQSLNNKQLSGGTV